MGVGSAEKAILYDRFMEKIQDYAIVFFDPEGRIGDWSLGAERIFGYTREEVEGKPAGILFTPEDREAGAAEAEMDGARRGSRAVDERWHIRKDGSRFWSSGFLYSLDDGRGSDPGFVKVLRDVSDRRDSLLAIAEVEKKVEIFLENIKDHAVFMINNQGRIASWNRGAERMFGWSEAEAIDKPYESLLAPEDAGRGIVERELGFADQAGSAEDERWHRRKDGSFFWAAGTLVPLFLQGGPAKSYVKILQDVTERKRIEEAQRLESIGRLAGGIAHDFNNLLTTMIGYAEMIAVWDGDEEMKRDWALEIKRAGDRAAALTAQLLAYGRKQVLSPRTVNLNSLIVGMGALLDATLGKDVELSLNLAPDLEEIQFDPGQLEQVILNLVLNAKEACPQGGRISISTSNLDLRKEEAGGRFRIAPGRYVLLTIADTGVGMDQDTVSKIFEPFFSTKKTGGSSSGLGLPAALGILHQSGGGITVASEPGRGAEFRIYLSTARLLPVRLKPNGRNGDPEGRRMRILLVEDEAAIRKMVGQALQSSGFEVVEAENGREGLDLFRSRPAAVDLVLSDVVIPGMGGIELAASILSLRPEIPVLLMSGYAEESAWSVSGIRPAHFIRKPFSLAELIRRVETALNAQAKEIPHSVRGPEII